MRLRVTSGRTQDALGIVRFALARVAQEMESRALTYEQVLDAQLSIVKEGGVDTVKIEFPTVPVDDDEDGWLDMGIGDKHG